MDNKNIIKKVSDKQIKKKIKEAIVMVNDVCKVRLASSEVHGIGVFAIRDIKRGERVYADAMPNMLDIPYKEFKKIKPEIRQLILERFPRIAVDNSHFMCPDTLMQIYMNHNNEPNYNNITDKATRKIKKGDEVFENYRNIKGWEAIHKWLL